MGHKAKGLMVRVSVIACQGGDSHGGGGESDSLCNRH